MFSAIEQIIGYDPAGRNITGLILPGELERAARSLISASKAAIVSGFFVPSAGMGETDGPPGAVAIGNALARLGVETAYVTDAQNAPLFEALGATPLWLGQPGLLEQLRPSHLIAVERLGRAADGKYYNMRGEDITAHTPPLDQWFLEAPARHIVTIAIGDGGNEIGMGRVQDRVARDVHLGKRIASVVPADHLIVAGVSNWGAYGLVAALGLLTGQSLLPTLETVRGEIQKLVEIGAVDGNTRRGEPTVDGQEMPAYLAVLEALTRLGTLATGGAAIEP